MRLPLSFLAAALALPLLPASVSAAPKATASSPILHFRLPTFTDEGFRQTMIRAEEALLPDPSRIDAKEMELTVFTGKADEQIDAMLAAPVATIFPQKQLATGPDTVRVERIDLTVTGADWSYDHAAKIIIIKRDAHVTMRAAIGDILK